MDTNILKKKLSTYLSEKGQLRGLPDELLGEVLVAWEQWSGTAKEFYKSVGFTHRQMAGLIGKAKKLKREGRFGNGEFKEVQPPQEVGGTLIEGDICQFIELHLGDGRVIRFPRVPELLEFIKKAS